MLKIFQREALFSILFLQTVFLSKYRVAHNAQSNTLSVYQPMLLKHHTQQPDMVSAMTFLDYWRMNNSFFFYFKILRWHNIQGNNASKKFSNMVSQFMYREWKKVFVKSLIGWFVVLGLMAL